MTYDSQLTHQGWRLPARLVFAPVGVALRRWERGSFDLSQPRREIARLNRALTAVGKRALRLFGLRDGKDLLRYLLGSNLLRDLVREFMDNPAPAPRSARAQRLIQYLSEVDEVVPYAPFMATFGVIFGPDWMPNQLMLIHKRSIASVGRGERRAIALVDAIRFATEHVHQPIVRALYFLERARREERGTGTSKYGCQCRRVLDATEPERIIHAEAVRLRRATTHHARIEHLESSRLLRLRNQDGWERVYTLPELFEELAAIHDEVITFQKVTFYLGQIWFGRLLRGASVLEILDSLRALTGHDRDRAINLTLEATTGPMLEGYERLSSAGWTFPGS